MFALKSLRRLSYLPIATLVACSTVIKDDWGSSGFARVGGVVRGNTGIPLADVPIEVGCGLHSTTEFSAGNARSAPNGSYLVEVEAPGVYGRPGPSGIEFMCHLQARQSVTSVIADSTITLRFTETRESASLITINLQQH